MSYRSYIAAIAASASLAACSGGGGGSSPVATPATQSPSQGGGASQAQSESVIADTNALGSPLKTFADFDSTIAPASATAQAASRTRNAATGACRNGIEFFAPDRNGDAHSTETLDFYDTACTSEARDIVRVFASTSASSETVAVTESQFAAGNATPIATRSESHAITSATFNANGYPMPADGFNLVAADTLNISGSKTIVSAREIVMDPSSNDANSFCSDSAGYNATGVASLGETFGWQGGVLSGGARTTNADESITWTATHAGTTEKAAIGSLSIVTGEQNTACPIVTPDFTLGGGTNIGSYSIPISATYLHGMLENISITNATLSNGTALSVTTNGGVSPSSPGFITGTIAKGTTQIATFAINAFGDGTLTSTATGAQYVITDWHVVR